MFNEKIEELIAAALADGEITEKEMQILRKRAEKEGIDPDEFEMVLNARLTERQQRKSNEEECNFSLKEKDWRKTGRKIFLNLIPWALIILVSIIESATLHPFMSLFTWGITGHNLMFWLLLLEHGVGLLIIWGIVLLLKVFVYDTLPEKSKKRLKNGIPLPEKGKLPASTILKESLSLPGFGWRLAIILFVVYTISSAMSYTHITFGIVLISAITSVFFAYITVFVLEFLYLYIFNNGSTTRRVIIFSVIGVLIAGSIVFNTVDGVKNSSFGYWLTEVIARYDHDTDKLTRLTRHYLDEGDMHKALEFAGIDYAENGDPCSTIMIINHCIENKDYDLASDLAVGIEHDGYIEKLAMLFIDEGEYDKASKLTEGDLALQYKLADYRWNKWEETQQYDCMLAQLQKDQYEECRYEFKSVSEDDDCNETFNSCNARYNQRLNRFIEFALRNNQIEYATQCLSLYQPYSYLVSKTLVKKRTILSNVYHYRFEARHTERDKAEQRIKQFSNAADSDNAQPETTTDNQKQ